MTRTTDPSTPAVDGLALATAWLAAGSAGIVNKADGTLDRAVAIEVYRDDAGRPVGIQFVGASGDLVVCARTAYVTGSLKKLDELVIEGVVPAEVWPIDDAHGVGAPLIRQVRTAAAEASEKGGTIRCTLRYTDYVAPGSLNIGEPVISIEVDGITEGTLVRLARFTPRDWRYALPASGSEGLAIPATAIIRKVAQIDRLKRLYTALGIKHEATWTYHRLPSGAVAEYLRHEVDGVIVEASAFVKLAGEVSLAGFFNAPETLEDAAYPQTSDPAIGGAEVVGQDDAEWEMADRFPRPDGGYEPDDEKAANVVRGAFGSGAA